MASSGKSLLGMLLAGVLAAASCSGESRPEGGDRSSQKPSTSSSQTSWTPREGKPARNIEARLEDAWKVNWNQTVRPFKSNTDADQVVGSVFGDDFSGVALVDTSTGKIKSRVDTFADPDAYQATGESNDRYAIWKELQTAGGSDEFVVKVWDRATDRVREVGSSRRADDGHAFASSWQAPVLSGDKAAWIEGTDDQGRGDLILQDLDSGKKTVVQSAHPGWLAMSGDTLIWAESPSAGALTELHAIATETHKAVELPAALKDLRGAAFLVTDGKAAAWVQPDKSGASLVVTPDVNQSGVTVTQVTNDGFSPPLLMTPSVIASSISGGGLVVVDRETGVYVVHKNIYSAEAAGSVLLVGGYNKMKERRPTTARAVLPSTDAVKIEPH